MARHLTLSATQVVSIAGTGKTMVPRLAAVMTGGRIYIGLVVADPSVVQKLHEKHSITLPEVQEALQWPARAEAVVDDDPEHGWRVLAFGSTADGREVFGVLLPEPEHDWEQAETWRIKSARWL